jgi:hypothetical protein
VHCVVAEIWLLAVSGVCFPLPLPLLALPAAPLPYCQLLGDFLAQINHHRGLYDKLRQTQAAYSATAAAAASSSPADAQLSSGEQVRCNELQLKAVTSCSLDCAFMLFMVLLP